MKATRTMRNDSQRTRTFGSGPDRRTDLQGLAVSVRLLAQDRPNGTAIVDGDVRWSYAQLAAASAALQERLLEAGVQAGDIVGIAVARSRYTVSAIVAVVGMGATYVPLDPDYPPDRLGQMIEDSGARFVCLAEEFDWLDPGITRIHVVAEPSVEEGNAPAASSLRSAIADPAYIIFTSGSTGVPKGVAVPETAVLSLLEASQSVFDFRSDDVWTLFHSHCFDFSVWEIWASLTLGATLVVVDSSTARNPDTLLDLLAVEKVTVLNQVPSAFKYLAAAQAEDPRALSVRYIIFGGEALDKPSVRCWLDRVSLSTRLVNMYGITETTVHVTFFEVTRDSVDDDSTPTVIGRALPHLEVQLIDLAGQAVRPGQAGELVVSGAGLASGYVGRPELTEDRFPTLTIDGEQRRWYRSGDLCRFDADGALEYLGRIDDQLSLRGYRIEPGEIEAKLRQVSGVRDAAVGVKDTPAGEQILVAYVVPMAGASNEELSPARLQRICHDALPSYMVPGRYVAVSELPTTASGKLDRSALDLATPIRSARSGQVGGG